LNLFYKPVSNFIFVKSPPFKVCLNFNSSLNFGKKLGNSSKNSQNNQIFLLKPFLSFFGSVDQLFSFSMRSGAVLSLDRKEVSKSSVPNPAVGPNRPLTK